MSATVVVGTEWRDEERAAGRVAEGMEAGGRAFDGRQSRWPVS